LYQPALTLLTGTHTINEVIVLVSKTLGVTSTERKVSLMRFAMIAPYQGVDSLAPVRDDLDFFNVEVVTLGLPSAPDPANEAAARFDAAAERVLDDLVFSGPWDGVLVAANASACGGRFPADAVQRLARRIRHILGRQLPVGVVNDVNVDLSRQLFDGIMALWFLRVVALDAADRTPGR